MSKQYRLGFVAAVICLSIILLSSDTDAQPTVGLDETASCSSSTLEEVANVVKTLALNQRENAKNVNEVKALLSSNQQQNAAEFQEVKNLLASNPSNEVEPSKQALVSALVSNCIPLLIQQNVNGSDFFNRSWAEFKVGFNDTRGNYWLGNELLSQLTVNGRYKLKFDLQSRNHSYWYYAEYSTFIVHSETTNYTLQVDGFSGNAGYDALRYNKFMMFTTYDRDNDPWAYHPQYNNNCAVIIGGGFWYATCGGCHVNGHGREFIWTGLPEGWDLQSSRMWLQCK